METERNILVVVETWAETSPNNDPGYGASSSLACTTLEEGIEILKSLEESYIEKTKEDCEVNNLDFDESNLDIVKVFDNRHIDPYIKVSYFDEFASTTFEYKAELSFAELKTFKKKP